MKKSKLLALLETFDGNELRQFKDFVASPYFNSNQDLVRFVEYLYDLSPDFPVEKLEKEKAWKALFPGGPFDGKQLSYLMNYLLKLAERFLAVQHYESHPFFEEYHVLRAFSSRKLDKHFGFLYKKTVERINLDGEEDAERSYFRYQLSELASDHAMIMRSKVFDQYFQQASDDLDEYYFLNKLKYSCEMLNREKIFSSNYELHFTDEVVRYLQQKPDPTPLTSIYLQIYLTLSQADSEHSFDQLLELLREKGGGIKREELRQVYLYAINFCLRNIRKGEHRYISLALDLYLEGIKRRALFEGDYLSPHTYTNVIRVALMLNRYDWIEEFIQTYHEYLPPKNKKDAYHISLAELNYHRKNYGEVLDHLNQLSFSDIRYHLGSRVLLIKTYYESDAIEPMLSSLAAFSTYLRRNKNISQSLKKTHLNFCNLLHQTMRINPRNWEAIRRQIQEMQPLTERSWLLKVWEEKEEV